MDKVNSNVMRVQKRNGTFEVVSFDKVLRRIMNLCNDAALGKPLEHVNPFEIAQKVCMRINDGIKTSQLDEFAAQMCSSLISEHPDYGTLAARIIISNIHKNTSPSFSEVIMALYNNKDKQGNNSPLVSDLLYNVVMANRDKINNYINYNRDFTYDFFGFKTLEKSYITKIDGVPVERPQHLLMRVALGIHGEDIKDALETYDCMSKKYFIHATPTLFNSGTRIPQQSSCYLLAMKDDSIAGMYETLADCAQISKYAGGIGLHVHNIRANGSYIRGTNGHSSGLVPMLRVYNTTARHVNQCFTPDTMVCTSKGRKPIAKICVGTDVMTMDGSYKPVLGVARNAVDKDILVISTEFGKDNVHVTDEHEIYVLRQGETTPSFVLAKDIVPGDRVGFPADNKHDDFNLHHGDLQVVGNIMWHSITNITKTHYVGDVYDLNVQDNHNYVVANLGLVHNSGRRNGSIAIYLEPWHADVETFLDLKKNHGAEEERARDLFYAMWIPDLFMERVRNNGMWSLMCPDECRGLADAYGADFKTLYESYESAGKYRKQIKAQVLWNKILESQIETGTPYMLYKDAVNRKNNQKNLGTIKSSNLCTEVTIYSSNEEYGTCNLASMCLPTYVSNGTFDFDKLHDMVKVVTKNLNKIIDNNFYPTKETANSNFRHRPIGLGVQGLADVFAMLKLPFDGPEAAQLNRDIFETMYHAAAEESVALAKKRAYWFAELKHEYPEALNLPYTEETVMSVPPLKKLNFQQCELEALSKKGFPVGAYSSFLGSPASHGQLQFDLWGVTPSSRYDWAKLKADIQQYGMRNSLLLAPMPTASTSQIMGFNECFEPFTSNLYKRKTLAGEFIVVNKYLMTDLMELGLWTPDIKEQIMIGEGSIQHIQEIPQDIRDRYKTVWEIKQRTIIDMAADRGAFICQSQSMNLFVETPDFKKLTSMHFYAWQKGLKTGMYYLRTKPKSMAQQFTVDPRKAKSNITIERPISPKDESPKVTKQVEETEDIAEQEAVGCQWKPGCKTCSS